jgi:hypothetical protein
VAAGVATIGFGWTLTLAYRAFERERGRLANSVICYIGPARNVTVRNLSNTLVTEVWVRAHAAEGGPWHIPLVQTFVLPNDQITGQMQPEIPDDASLTYGFMDTRGDSWERAWGSPAHRLNGIFKKRRRT